MMARFFYTQLPAWARPDHPAVRYQRGGEPTSRRRWLAALGSSGAIALALLVGYLIATRLLTIPAGQNPVEGANAALYYPLLAGLLAARLLAVLLTSTTIATEIRRQNWDNLRATERGAELTFRARWMLVFYRLNGLLLIMMLARALLIGMALFELTAFQGRYLDLLINGIIPTISVPIAILLLALLFTAALLLPITMIGFDAAVGLLIATTAPERGRFVLLQVGYLLFRVVSVIGLTVLTGAFLAGDLRADAAASGLLLAAQGAIADGGLAFLHLARLGEIWAIQPYGIALGAALIAFVLGQAIAADRVLIWAIRRAQQVG